jgi:hypothetical protein
MSDHPIPPSKMDGIKLTYTNWRGETGIRHIIPGSVWFGVDDHHPRSTGQWFIDCFDIDKQANRTYALADCDFTTTAPIRRPRRWSL